MRRISETENRFFWRSSCRDGKCTSEMRAGWLPPADSVWKEEEEEGEERGGGAAFLKHLRHQGGVVQNGAKWRGGEVERKSGER